MSTNSANLVTVGDDGSLSETPTHDNQKGNGEVEGSMSTNSANLFTVEDNGSLSETPKQNQQIITNGEIEGSMSTCLRRI